MTRAGSRNCCDRCGNSLTYGASTAGPVFLLATCESGQGDGRTLYWEDLCTPCSGMVRKLITALTIAADQGPGGALS